MAPSFLRPPTHPPCFEITVGWSCLVDVMVCVQTCKPQKPRACGSPLQMGFLFPRVSGVALTSSRAPVSSGFVRLSRLHLPAVDVIPHCLWLSVAPSCDQLQHLTFSWIVSFAIAFSILDTNGAWPPALGRGVFWEETCWIVSWIDGYNLLLVDIAVSSICSFYKILAIWLCPTVHIYR